MQMKKNVESITPLIALLTDFGQDDHYAGVMKGVILGINPAARIIDLCHGILPQNILGAAYMLYGSYRYFPENTIFCAVVDPGVGSDRKALCIKTRDYLFVGPDNGILWTAASDNGIKECICLTRECFFLDSISTTFHGRDIFAPVCAHLSSGVLANQMGEPVSHPVELDFMQPRPVTGGYELTVLHVDRFGNLVLNLSVKDIALASKPVFHLTIKGTVITRLYHAYALAPDDGLFVISGSSGFFEISRKNSSAAKALGAAAGDKALFSGAVCAG